MNSTHARKFNERKQLKSNLTEAKYSGKSFRIDIENVCRKVSEDSIYK